MKPLKLLIALLVALDFLTPTVGLLNSNGAVAAQTLPIPYVSGPQDPGQLNRTFNTLIQQLNNVLVPTFPQPSGAVNTLRLGAGLTGSPATISLQAGADTNAGIAINPNGNGNVTLFNLSTGKGLLQFGNQFSWYPATGLAPCPGAAAKASAGFGIGPGTVVTGHVGMLDWLGRSHFMVACG